MGDGVDLDTKHWKEKQKIEAQITGREQELKEYCRRKSEHVEGKEGTGRR